MRGDIEMNDNTPITVLDLEMAALDLERLNKYGITLHVTDSREEHKKPVLNPDKNIVMNILDDIYYHDGVCTNCSCKCPCSQLIESGLCNRGMFI